MALFLHVTGWFLAFTLVFHRARWWFLSCFGGQGICHHHLWLNFVFHLAYLQFTMDNDSQIYCNLQRKYLSILLKYLRIFVSIFKYLNMVIKIETHGLGSAGLPDLQEYCILKEISITWPSVGYWKISWAHLTNIFIQNTSFLAYPL